MEQDIVFSLTVGQVGSLAFLSYEFCITLDDEVETIWLKPNCSWIKWQFLFIRYFSLASQIINRALEGAVFAHSKLSMHSLRNWYTCQVVIGSILMTAVEVVLIARVFALYNRNFWVGLIFVALLLGEASTLITGIMMSLPGLDFDLNNFLISSPMSFVYFGTAALVSQSTILVLTLMKYRSAFRDGWANAPIMQLMVRDGTMAFCTMFLVTLMTIMGTFMQNRYSPIGNSWFISLVACAGCRLIINMQRLPAQETDAHNDVTTAQFTTLLESFVPGQTTNHRVPQRNQISTCT